MASPACSAARATRPPTPSRWPRRSCRSWATSCRCSPRCPRTPPPPTRPLSVELAPLLAARPGRRRLGAGRGRRHRGRAARPGRATPPPRRPHGQAADRRRRAHHPRPLRHPGDDGRRRRHAGEVVLVGGGDDAVPDRPLPDLPGRADGRRARHPGRRRHAGRHLGHPRRRRQLAVQRAADRHRLGTGRRPLQLRGAGDGHGRRRRPGQPRLAGPQRAARPGRRRRSPTPSARAGRPSCWARRPTAPTWPR